MPGISEIREAGQFSVSEYDTWLPLMSLPRIFGTTLGTIPDELPYIDVDSVRRRKDITAFKIPDSGDAPRIGIAWGGNPVHVNDQRRSCPLSAFVPLLRTPGLAFYSLQKGKQREDLAELPSDVTLQDLDTQLGDYGDLVVILNQLDLVITVDNTVAHVAGAIGKPVWVLISALPDWHWGLEGDITPWYPGMQLARQDELDEEQSH